MHIPILCGLLEEEDTCMSYEEEDTCTWFPILCGLPEESRRACRTAEGSIYMRRRKHACHMRRRIHA
jgi:hypothetical protein